MQNFTCKLERPFPELALAYFQADLRIHTSNPKWTTVTSWSGQTMNGVREILDLRGFISFVNDKTGQ